MPSLRRASDPHPLLQYLPFVLGLLACLPMLRNDFTADDFTWVSNAIRSQDHLWYLVRAPHKEDFRPLVCATFLANLLVFGIRPFGYSLVNLAIHLVNTGLVIRLAGRVTGGRRDVAWLAGALFAVTFGNYGLAVVWICGRTGPLADTFVLAGLLAYWDGLRGDRGGRAWAVAYFVLGLLTKESSVMLVPMLVLAEWMELESPRAVLNRATGRRLLPFVVLMAGYLVFHFGYWRRGSQVLENEYVFGPHALGNLAEYLVRMVQPVNTTTLMVPLPGAARAIVEALGRGLGVVVPLGWLALFLGSRSRAVRFSVLWMVMNLAPYVWFTLRTNTRYLYGPSVGLCILVALGLAAWRERAGRSPLGRWLPAVTAAALIVASAAALNVVILQVHRLGGRMDPERKAEIVRLMAEHERARH